MEEKIMIEKIDIALVFLYDMLTGLDFKYYPKDVEKKLHDLIDYVGNLIFSKNLPPDYDIEEEEYFVVTTLRK